MSTYRVLRPRTTMARRVLGVGAIAVGLAGLLAPVQAAAAGSCSVYWTGAVSSSWTSSANWSLSFDGGGPGRVPLNTDYVCMAAAPTRTAVSYTSLSRAIAGIDFSVQGSLRPSLTVDGGLMTIGSGVEAFDSVINDLEVRAGGVVTGLADQLLTGSPFLSDDAILAGPGTTTLAAGTNVTTNGLILDTGRRLVVKGTLTHDECYDYVYLYNGAVLQNAGRINAASSCGHRIFSDGSDGSKLVNSAGATLAITQAAGETYDLDVRLENRGTVEVSAGSLIAHPLMSTSGDYDVPAGAQLRVGAGGTLWLGPDTWSGAGTLALAGGTIDVEDGLVLGALELSGGTLTGDPTFQSLSGGTGTTFTGGGNLTVAVGGTATLDALTIDGGSRLVNRGVLTHTGCAGPLQLRSGSALQNVGTLTVATTCSSAITSDGSSGTAVNNNAGARLIVGQLRPTDSYRIEPALENAGRIEVTKGIVELPNLTNLVSGRLDGGEYVATNGTIELPGNVTSNNGSITMTTSGRLVNPVDADALDRLATNTGSITLHRGLTFDVPLVNSGNLTVTQHQVDVPSYRQTGGSTSLTGDGALVSLDGPGSTVIDGGALTGDGRVYTVAGTGTTRPVGELVVSGLYSPAATGTLAIAIGPPATPNRLLVNGQATLAGTLAISTQAGFTPTVGTTYSIVKAVRWSGAFTTVVGQGLPGGLYYDLSYTADAVKLTVRGLPQLGIDDAAASVGNDGVVPMTFTVELSSPSSLPVTVDYETEDGSARAGSDYVAQSGTLVFPPGVSALPVVVVISRDNGPEPVETFSVVLRDPDNADLGDARGTGTITHDAGAATLPVITGFSPATVGLGANGAQVTMSGEYFIPGSTVTVVGTALKLVDTAFVDSQAMILTLNAFGPTTLGPNDVTVTNPGLGSDTCAGCLTVVPRPQPMSASPSLATGATAAIVTVTGTDFKPGSSVNLTGGSGVTLTHTYVSATTLRLSVTVFRTATIGDYDIRVVNPDGGIGTCTDCFTVFAGPTLTSMSPATVARGTTTNVTLGGSRFAAGATLTPPPGVSFTNVEVSNPTTITARMTVDATRSRTNGLPVSVVNPASAGSGSGGCNCLNVATMVSAADAAASVGDGGPVDMVFQISLDSSVQVQVSVNYRTVSGSATQGSDYVGTSGTLTFAPGTTTKSLTVSILRDSGFEPVETFTVVLDNPLNAALADSVAVGTITHDGSAAAAPVLEALSPDTVGPGASARQLTLDGRNFEPNTTVSVVGSGVTITDTDYVNQTTMRITVSAWATLTPQTRDVTVTTPRAGSSTCAGCLRVTAKPTPAAATPSLATGATQRTVTVTGTDFKSGATANLQPTGAGAKVTNTEYVSATSLRLTVDVTESANTGGYDVRIVNPDGGAGTCVNCFTVTAGPTVTLLTPPTVLRGTSIPVTLAGTRFINGAKVVGPEGVTFSNVVVVSSVTITARITVDVTRARGSNLPVTVINPASAGYGQGTCRCLGITV